MVVAIRYLPVSNCSQWENQKTNSFLFSLYSECHLNNVLINLTNILDTIGTSVLSLPRGNFLNIIIITIIIITNSDGVK